MCTSVWVQRKKILLKEWFWWDSGAKLNLFIMLCECVCVCVCLFVCLCLCVCMCVCVCVHTCRQVDHSNVLSFYPNKKMFLRYKLLYLLTDDMFRVCQSYWDRWQCCCARPILTMGLEIIMSGMVMSMESASQRQSRSLLSIFQGICLFAVLLIFIQICGFEHWKSCVLIVTLQSWEWIFLGDFLCCNTVLEASNQMY